MKNVLTMFNITRDNLLLMLVLFIGYMMVVFVRESVTYSAPIIADAENLADSDLGLIVSSQKLGYTMIKFVGGSMVDLFDPGLLFTVCLLLTGVTGMGFTACSSVSKFSLTWFISGLVQGPLWPSCAMLLRKAFTGSQFAFWWSILSSSSNVASTVGPLMSQALSRTYSWRASFLLSGAVCIVISIVGGIFLRNFQKRQAAARGTKSGSKSLSIGALLNPVVFVVCLDYFLFSIVRGACNDWSQHYVIHGKKQSIITGGQFLSIQEVGGIVGSVAAAYLSDVPVGKDQHHAMPRLKNQFLFSFLLTVGLFFLIFFVDSQSPQIWLHATSFVIGFALYGCITLVGVVCMEVAPSHLEGTSLSFGTLCANVGRVVAGYPLTMIAGYSSWHASFITALLISLMSVIVSFVLIRMVNTQHRMEGKEKES